MLGRNISQHRFFGQREQEPGLAIFRCKIWVDRLSGRLRIGNENADETSQLEFISLYEAARTAYEHTLDTWGKAAAQIEHNDPDRIITWFCYHLGPRLTIYGERPPSQVQEAYSIKEQRHDHDFVVVDSAIEARGRHDEGRWINLRVRDDELRIVVRDMKNQAVRGTE